MDKILKKKVDYFYNNKIKVHITLTSSKWYNGIIRKLKKEYLIIEESVQGEQIVFFLEIFDIEQCKPPNFNSLNNKRGENDRIV